MKENEVSEGEPGSENRKMSEWEQTQRLLFID